MTLIRRQAISSVVAYKISLMAVLNTTTLSKVFLAKMVWLITILVSAFALSACQTTPSSTINPVATTNNSAMTPSDSSLESDPVAANDIAIDSSDSDADEHSNIAIADIADDVVTEDYPIESYIPPKTTTATYPAKSSQPKNDPIQAYEPVIKETTVYQPVEQADDTVRSINNLPALPSHDEMLQQARQSSQQRTTPNNSSNDSLPAFRKLMEVGINQLKSGQLTAAESSFTRAQRLAPKSSAVYFYLAQVAIKKNQPHKAEAMARRGLVVPQDKNRRRALWQIILQAGQLQNNSRVINEAKQALN